jgi:electron transfer flavoprotein beta subunit
LIKEVPETSNVKMDETTGTIVRSGVESIVNPLDLYAIETALRLKQSHGASITVMTMGPLTASRSLREAVAMGCDDCILLSAKEFAGSDTYATAKVLSAACKKTGGFDLILCGERATDGDTSQVGPETASMLNIPIATYVSKIVNLDDKRIIVERLVENGYETLSMPLPCLLTVLKEICIPRLPTLKGKQSARKVEPTMFNASDLPGVTAGLNGSPTRVVKITTPKVTRCGQVIVAKERDEMEAAAKLLVSYLKDKNLIAKKGIKK